MDENTYLGDVITDALNDWLAVRGGGFPTSFVFAVDYVNSEGVATLTICDMPEQKTRASLGLVGELSACYDIEARVGWAQSQHQDCDECEDEQ